MTWFAFAVRNSECIAPNGCGGGEIRMIIGKNLEGSGIDRLEIISPRISGGPTFGKVSC